VDSIINYARDWLHCTDLFLITFAFYI